MSAYNHTDGETVESLRTAAGESARIAIATRFDGGRRPEVAMTQSSTLGGHLATAAFNVATVAQMGVGTQSPVATSNAPVASCPPSVEDWVMATSGLLPPSKSRGYRYPCALAGGRPQALDGLSISMVVRTHALGPRLVVSLVCVRVAVGFPCEFEKNEKKRSTPSHDVTLLSGRQSTTVGRTVGSVNFRREWGYYSFPHVWGCGIVFATFNNCLVDSFP